MPAAFERPSVALSKRTAAQAALAYVEPGMRLGLGSGSTAEILVELLGEQVREGLRVTAIPTSRRTEALARAAGIPLTDFTTGTRLDLTLDGADELDPKLRLLKGRGGAILYEKIVAAASDRMIAIVDTSKLVAHLGLAPLPVEVVQFALPVVADALNNLGATTSLRKGRNGRPWRSQAGHLMLDAQFAHIAEPELLAERLDALPGVMAHGLFLGLASFAVVAEGERSHLVRLPGSPPC